MNLKINSVMTRKKVMLCLLTVLLSTAMQAQIKFGVKAGYNLASMSLSGDVLQSSNKAGFFFGPTVKLSLPLTGLGIDGSVLYNQVSSDVTVEQGVSHSMVVKQLAIPLHLRYGIGLGSVASAFFFAGPQFAFNVADDIKQIDWKWKNAYTSANIGAGVSLLKHFQLHLNYNIGLSNMGEAQSDTYGSLRGKARVWQMGAAYYF